MSKAIVLLDCTPTPPIQIALEYLTEKGVVANALYYEFITILNSMVSSAHHHEMDIATLMTIDPLQFINGGESLIIKMLREVNYTSRSNLTMNTKDLELHLQLCDIMLNETLVILRAAYTELVKLLIYNVSSLIESCIKQHVSFNLLNVNYDTLQVELVYYVKRNHRPVFGNA